MHKYIFNGPGYKANLRVSVTLKGWFGMGSSIDKINVYCTSLDSELHWTLKARFLSEISSTSKEAE